MARRRGNDLVKMPPLRRHRSLGVLIAAAAILAVALLGLVLLYDVPSTGSAEGGDAVVWAVGDGADGGDAAVEVAGQIEDSPVDRLLYLGDVYETGTATEFEEHYEPVYGELASLTAPTIGNHEWFNREEGYLPYWESVTGEEQPLHYSFELAGWEVISLNSEGERDSILAEARWLRGQLDEQGTCRLVFWHTPRYSAGIGAEYGDDAGVEPFWDVLAGHARIVVNADQHNMQRFEPVRGITQFVAGAGGHGLYDLDLDDPRLAFGNDEDYGALRFDLEPGRAGYSFVGSDGDILDSGTIPCERPRKASAPQ